MQRGGVGHHCGRHRLAGQQAGEVGKFEHSARALGDGAGRVGVAVNVSQHIVVVEGAEVDGYAANFTTLAQRLGFDNVPAAPDRHNRIDVVQLGSRVAIRVHEDHVVEAVDQ